MIRDQFQRPLRSLRLSVTDRCNLRCRYCMPEDDYVWLPRPSILRFEEIARLARLFAAAGVSRLRLTGGEPLLRRDLHRLVAMLAQVPGIDDLALTTNGVLLAAQATELRRAGLRRITVSLDTLRADRFERATRSGTHREVLAGIDAVRRAGFGPVKINAVVARGFNDDEIVDLVRFARDRGAEVRFIEYMDVGGANLWTAEQVVPQTEILAAIERAFGPLRSDHDGADPAAPAERFRLPDGTRFGVIASTTAPFCRTCDRSRLTADGRWYHCLYAADGIDLGAPLRDGTAENRIAALIRTAWTGRTDRGAEQRLALRHRRPAATPDALRRNPHLEMHTRGG